MHWVDMFYFPELLDRLADLDARLHALVHERATSPDPDTLGILDETETVVGEGFFFCQRYMIQRKGSVRNAYSHGARIGSRAFASVINAAANYWKHVGEWDTKPQLDRREQHTLDVIRDAGGTHPDRPLSQLLLLLDPNARLSNLVPRIVDWRDAIDRYERARSAEAQGWQGTEIATVGDRIQPVGAKR